MTSETEIGFVSRGPDLFERVRLIIPVRGAVSHGQKKKFLVAVRYCGIASGRDQMYADPLDIGHWPGMTGTRFCQQELIVFRGPKEIPIIFV